MSTSSVPKRSLADWAILTAIDAEISACGFAWLPTLCRLLGESEAELRRRVDQFVALGLVRWRKAGIWGNTDIERVPA
jgi:hypothetical protein